MTRRLRLKRLVCRVLDHRRVRTPVLTQAPVRQVTIHCGRCGTFLGWDGLTLGDF